MCDVKNIMLIPKGLFCSNNLLTTTQDQQSERIGSEDLG